MTFNEASRLSISPESSKRVNDSGLLRSIYRPQREEIRRAEVLQGDKAKQDAENLLKDLPATKKEKAREVTENGEVIAPEKLAILLKNIPPERQKIIDAVKVYLGTNEKDNAALIAKFHESAGVKNGDCDTAWCMSFVQQVLKDLGKQPAKPTAWARDGLNIGTPVTKPSPGDLVIVERGEGGHIGFYIGESDSGNPIIIGGNQGAGEVSAKEETRPVLGYRSIV